VVEASTSATRVRATSSLIANMDKKLQELVNRTLKIDHSLKGWMSLKIRHEEGRAAEDPPLPDILNYEVVLEELSRLQQAQRGSPGRDRQPPGRC